MLDSYDLNQKLNESSKFLAEAKQLLIDPTPEQIGKFKELIVNAHRNLDICADFFGWNVFLYERNYVIVEDEESRNKETRILQRRIEIIKQRINSIKIIRRIQ